MDETSIIGLTLAGRFRVTGMIGEGGMATVYRAAQEVEPHDVAIKVMNPDLAKDSRFVRRFRREAKAASMLKHPNTVEILEFGVDQGFVYLAMECLEGADLALLLHRERRVSELRAAKILIQVCGALSAAHEKAIVHRDLKPDNIMIVKRPTSDEHVKVLDFGIAKILDEDGTASADPRAEPITSAKSMLTRVGTIVGTPAYMAPEQGRAEAVDARTDIYACGILLYELVIGKVPFNGETPMQIVMRHVNEAPERPSKHLPVSPELEAVIMKALSKWPAERQQSAKELAAELTAILPRLSAEKRQLGESVSESIVLSLPKPPRTIAAAPVPEPLKRQDTNSSTLVIESKAPPQVSSAINPRASAPAFPTLNIDLPEDVVAGAMPAGAMPAPRGAFGQSPAAGSKPFPIPPRAAPSVEDDPDSDDVRTLIARETSSADIAPPWVSRPAAGAPPPAAPVLGSTMQTQPAPTRKSDAQPPILDKTGSAPNIQIGPFTSPEVDAARTSRDVPLRGDSSPGSSTGERISQIPPGGAGGLDKITTLVSALPEPGRSPATSKPAPVGTTPLGSHKGTAKVDPPVQVPVQEQPANGPSTKPSISPPGQAAATSIALDATQLQATPGPSPTPAPRSKETTSDAPALPVAKPSDPAPVAEAEPGGPVPAVWKPERRKMSGPMAMALGIVIGAILFAIVLVILKYRSAL